MRSLLSVKTKLLKEPLGSVSVVSVWTKTGKVKKPD
jgi:hypothetical protein